MDFVQILENGSFNLETAFYRENKEHFKRPLFLRRMKQISIEDFDSLNFSFILYNQTLVFLCPCGCALISTTQLLDPRKIIKDDPLTIKNMGVDYKGTVVKFSVIEGKIVFQEGAASHMPLLRKAIQPPLH